MKSCQVATIVTLFAVAGQVEEVAANYVSSHLAAFGSFFDSVAYLEDGTQGTPPIWERCQGTKTDPCKCATKEPKFVCGIDADNKQTLEEIYYKDVSMRSADGLFPTDTVRSLLEAVPTITSISILGDSEGLGDGSQPCLDLEMCNGGDITCDFSPRLICGRTFAPTIPTESPTVSILPQKDTWKALFNAMAQGEQVEVQNGKLVPDWDFCRGTLEDPCNCASKFEGFDCDNDGKLVNIKFLENNLVSAGNVFPAVEVNNMLKVATVQSISIKDNAGLGGTGDCLDIPMCHVKACDFAPHRTVCSLKVTTPSPTAVEDPEETTTKAPTDPIGENSASPTTSPTSSPTITPPQQAGVWQALFNAMAQGEQVEGQNGNLVPDWILCRKTLDDPCNCASKIEGFNCDNDGNLVDIKFLDNNLVSADNTFPAEEVNNMLKIESVMSITIIDNLGLGAAGECVDVPMCAEKICDFSPRSLCTPSPTFLPTSLPTMVPSSSPTTEPTETPSVEVVIGEVTSNPTTTPTGAPSAVSDPIASVTPTSSPTGVPTDYPTSSPTSSPTSLPSASPTKMPTGVDSTPVPTPRPTEGTAGASRTHMCAGGVQLAAVFATIVCVMMN